MGPHLGPSKCVRASLGSCRNRCPRRPRAQLTLTELQTLYRTQFPVLREYERATWFDRNGRIAFTANSQGLPGVGLSPKDFAKWRLHLRDSTPLPSGFDKKNLEPPFEIRDREEDMAVAYEYVAKKLGAPA